LELPSSLKNVAEHLRKIPGVGEKTAMKQSLILTKWDHTEIEAFGKAISELTQLSHCDACGMFSEEPICSICQESKRLESGLICVVEDISDYMAIESSGQFEGLYHILGGVLNPLLGVGPDQLRINQLLERVKDNNISDVVLAINPSVEGDATSSYIRQILPDNVNVERIGFGMPMGGSLEHLDAMTISKALENRRKMD
jgi:recombination protein RecR